MNVVAVMATALAVIAVATAVLMVGVGVGALVSQCIGMKINWTYRFMKTS